MRACSGRRDSGPDGAGPACELSFSLSLSKTWVASSSSSQSMFSFAPFGDVGAAAGTTPEAAAAGIEPVDGLLEIAAGPGRVLAGGGTWLDDLCVALGDCDGDAAAGMFDWLVGPCTACRFGSEPRPGGGGGFDGEAGGADGCAARIEPDCGGDDADDGSGGGCETRPEGGPDGPAAG